MENKYGIEERHTRFYRPTQEDLNILSQEEAANFRNFLKENRPEELRRLENFLKGSPKKA